MPIYLNSSTRATGNKKEFLPRVTNLGGTLRGEDTTDFAGVGGLFKDSGVLVVGSEMGSEFTLSCK